RLHFATLHTFSFMSYNSTTDVFFQSRSNPPMTAITPFITTAQPLLRAVGIDAMSHHRCVFGSKHSADDNLASLSSRPPNTKMRPLALAIMSQLRFVLIFGMSRHSFPFTSYTSPLFVRPSPSL